MDIKDYARCYLSLFDLQAQAQKEADRANESNRQLKRDLDAAAKDLITEARKHNDDKVVNIIVNSRAVVVLKGGFTYPHVEVTEVYS